ncbi:MAG TPA: histidine phosphatase family protein, partial [Kineosporiaceae bacterium]|nr:histidine phosphatase family protein [Kineosporiaceae bacterium]
MTVERAAGVLCWRQGRDGLEVLLVHRPRDDDWSWPKGTVKGSEPLPCTAVREAAEVTGLAVALGLPLGEVRYRLPTGRRTVVTYWAATVVGPAGAEPAGVPVERADPDPPAVTAAGEAAPDVADVAAPDVAAPDVAGPDVAAPDVAAPDVAEPAAPEVDDVAWLPVLQARTLLTRASDARPLRLLKEDASGERLATAPVLVVRHGTSRPRDSWAGGDADRPLARAGRRQAQALVPLVGCWQPHRLLSSPWRRCLDSIEPYAASAVLPVRTEAWLSEDGARRSPARVRRQMQRQLDRARPALLCTHRPVLELLFEVVRSACIPDAVAAVPTRDPYLAPGEVLVAHVARAG